jgi:hypothetical protein
MLKHASRIRVDTMLRQRNCHGQGAAPCSFRDREVCVAGCYLYGHLQAGKPRRPLLLMAAPAMQGADAAAAGQKCHWF